MKVLIVGCGSASAGLLSSALRACDMVCAVDAQRDDSIYEVVNVRVDDDRYLLEASKDVPHYRDLEFSKKKRRY